MTYAKCHSPCTQEWYTPQVIHTINITAVVVLYVTTPKGYLQAPVAKWCLTLCYINVHTTCIHIQTFSLALVYTSKP